MARERITEYSAKRMLLGDAYTGISVNRNDDTKLSALPAGTYVVKVDQGVKKRFLKGLVAVNVPHTDIGSHIKKWEAGGYNSFLIEPFIAHEQHTERYVSFDRVRDGIKVLWSEHGGIDVESGKDSIQTFLISDITSCTSLEALGFPRAFLEQIVHLMNTEYVSFIEINPILITSTGVLLLDSAVLVDGAGTFFAKAWGEQDVVHTKATHGEETLVAELQRSTASSLKLTVMNENGGLFFLLSGGGASIVALDGVHEAGFGKEIGNYGEYSGGPTREETYLYSKQVLSLLLKSKAPKKALVIAGGVANFTDVRETFRGVIDAIAEVSNELRNQNVNVFVRRGGPHEREGLEHMETFLKKENLCGAVYGSTTPITTAVQGATSYIQTS